MSETTEIAKRVLSETFATKAVAWLAVTWACDGEGWYVPLTKLVAIAMACLSLYRSWRATRQ